MSHCTARRCAPGSLFALPTDRQPRQRRFPDPDTYDIARKPKGTLDSAAVRMPALGRWCPNAVRIIFEEFLARFPEFSRTEGA